MKITLKKGWIAKDADGGTYWYESKPINAGTVWSNGNDLYILELELLNIPDLGHWKNSLHRVTENGELIKEHPELKIDQKVIVWNDENYKCKGHFSGWSKNGEIRTFDGGRTSFTNNNDNISTTNWDHYEIVD